MPADLQPVRMLADVIGVMDGPCAEPTQPLVEDLQRIDVGGRGLEHRRGLAERAALGKRVTSVQIYGLLGDLNRESSHAYQSVDRDRESGRHPSIACLSSQN